MSRPSTEEWRDLHESFREYCQAAPWQWMDDNDLLAVEHPSGSYVAYCAVMGSGGLEYGLAVYIGDEGLEAYLAVVTGEADPDSPHELDRVRGVSAMLADREVLDKTDRDIIRRLGLKYRGRGRWPLFRSLVPGYFPWYPDSEEAVLLTTALRSVMEVAARVARGELDLYCEDDPGRILTRVFRDGSWTDQWARLKLPQPPAAVPDYPDSERIRRMARTSSRQAATWEVSRFHIHAALQDKKGERPYLPMVVFAVDRDSGFVLNTGLLGKSPSTLEQQDALVGTLESAGWMPSEIVTDTTSTARIFESITTGLGIKLSVGPVPTLDHARESLMGFIENI